MNKEDRILHKKLQSYGPVTRQKAIDKWCGKKIASGANRDVYECLLNPNWVVKIQISNNFDNLIEWKIWDAVYRAEWWAKWFAACLTITESGMILIQQKVDFPLTKVYPKRVPRFFTDLKYKNYGFIDGQLKCVDYSNVLCMLVGLMDKRMRNAKWWTPYASKKKIKKYRNKENVIEAKL